MRNFYNYPSLFRDDQTVRRKKADQLHFEKHYATELPIFDSILRDAHQQTIELRSKVGLLNVSRNWEATIMSGFIQGGLRLTFPHKLRYIQGVYHYRDDEYLLIFKKLEKNYIPQNVSTFAALQRYYQRAQLSENPIPIVFIGYQVDPDFTTYFGTYATYSSDLQRPEWITSVESLSTDIAALEPETVPKTGGPRVILKNSLRKAE
jgi:hypothetical protein